MLRWALAGFFLLFPLFGPSFADTSPLVLRFSTQAPPGGEQFRSMLHFKERVEAESKGKIQIEIYDSGKLYDSHNIVAAVTSGKVEIGHVNLTHYADTVPLADAFSLPFMFSNKLVERAARAPNSEIRRLIDGAILEKSGARVLWWIPEGSFVLLANGMSMANPDTLAGKTVRSSGPTSADTLRSCGGEPKEIPATKQPEAYASGQVEIGMTSITAVLARKLFRFRDTITRTNQAFLNDVIVINENTWKSLPEDQRALLKSAAAIADKEASDLIADYEDQAYKQLVEQDGAKVVGLTDDDLRLWRICSSDVLSDYIEKTGESGRRLMAAYAKLLQDPCCNRTPGASAAAK